MDFSLSYEGKLVLKGFFCFFFVFEMSLTFPLLLFFRERLPEWISAWTMKVSWCEWFFCFFSVFGTLLMFLLLFSLGDAFLDVFQLGL